MASAPSKKRLPDSSTDKHFPTYKDFLFGGTITLYVGQDRRKMEIHKQLLESISPEFSAHVKNDMRRARGTESIIRLPEEEEETLTLFTEWAYTGEYGHESHTLLANMGSSTKLRQDPWASIHKHLQLCAFSEKFKIPILKQLAESKFYTEISCAEPTNSKDVSGLVAVMDYAYDNLPNSDPILKFLARYASWKLELLRPKHKFNQLILAQPELLKELLTNLKGPTTKPTAPAPQARPTHDRHMPSSDAEYRRLLLIIRNAKAFVERTR